MPVTAESVVVEVVAKLDKAEGDIKKLDATFSTSADRMKATASTLSANLDRVATQSTASFSKVGEGAKKAANDVDREAGRIANAQRNIGRQVSDIGTQLSGGQSPFLIFAQQAPQVADALADVGGKAGAVATFFAGPWGAAILAAGSILGTTLVPKLLEAANATDTLSGEQADLATFVDLATGALNRQRVAVERLAAAQSRQKDIEQGTRTYSDARNRTLIAIADAGGRPQPTFAAGVRLPEVAPSDPIKTRLREIAEEAVRTQRPINDVVLAVRKLVGDRPEYRDLVKSITAQGAAAVDAARSTERLKAEQRVLTGTATAADRALLGIGQTTTGLVEKQVALATATNDLERARARLALVEEQGRGIQAGDAAGLAKYRAELTTATQAVKSAEAAEKAAAQSKRDGAKASREAARDAKAAAREREQAARNAARAERELIGLRSELLGAQSNLTSDRALQDDFARQRINLDRAGRLDDAEERRRRGELTEAEFKERRELIGKLADAQLAYIDRTAAIRDAADQLELARGRSDAQREILDAENALSATADQRRKIELQLLDLAIEERRQAAQRVIDLAKRGLASDQERQLAQITLDSLPRIRELGQRRINQDNASPGERYRTELRNSLGDINSRIEAIEVRGLQTLEDSLVESTKAALGLKGALGDIVGELIRIGIQRSIIGPLADGLFGPAGGGGGGGLFGSLIGGVSRLFGGGRGGGGGGLGNAVGSILGAVGLPRLPGFATGGSMVLGGVPGIDRNTLSLNGAPIARVSRGETLAVSPNLGALRPAGAGTVVHQHFHLDARGAVTTKEFVQGLQGYADQRAAQAGEAAYKQALRDAPDAVSRRRRYG
ncbi:MAG: hypothetical protein A4S16_03445 [Proteobacteria bacterium SG_bin6]|nr:MAG: hypothetical protein A4S16_03445 [Proteobacteria bacterium SG_bin6]